MNQSNITAFWHKASFDRFMQERLPQLLGERLPLVGYQFAAMGTYTCQVTIAVTGSAYQQAVEVVYTDLPQPDEHGVFVSDGAERTVVPLAAHSELDSAEVQCVGEMLYELIAERLGAAPPDLPWDQALLRAWLPLAKWLAEFMTTNPYAQYLDTTNWLARQTHLRRLYIDNPTHVMAPGWLGRVCPFETPEGPNIARIPSIALGAAIRDDQLVVVDAAAEAAIGLSASMIPCLEHNDPIHLLMGANMLRQWLPYAQPEPALVQTGNEPNSPDFWCGRNLLTAFIPWGSATFADGIVLSESGAQHLSNGDAWVEPGDKLSNRHGIKGIISRILPDAEMPHLADGTPVELIFTSSTLHARMAFGQLREAVLGRLARVAGEPILAPPFHAPSEQEIRRQLAQANLPEAGMEVLRQGRNGELLTNPSTVGWVYWGRTNHLVRDKLAVAVDETQRLQAQRQGAMEVQTLHEIGALETIREHFNTRVAGRGSIEATGETLAHRVATGAVEQAGPPTPRFLAVQVRLAAMGIQATLEKGQVRFVFAPPMGISTLNLVQPIAHPWLQERLLNQIAAFPAATESETDDAPLSTAEQAVNKPAPPMPAYNAVVEANTKLARLRNSGAPKTLVEQAVLQLERSIRNYADALLLPTDLHFDNRVLFSGRSVLAPGLDLRYDQVGLADELAWTLFGPFVSRELGDREAVQQRTPSAIQALDAIMARSWVILNRAPTIKPTSMLAFHPIREAGRVIRLHPLACRLLDADFDGDQAAVFLPVTAAGQAEAGARLSLAGQLARDPSLVNELAPSRDAMWGLACLSLSAAGQTEIEQIVGAPVNASAGFVTRAALAEALAQILAERGIEATLAHTEQLVQRGFAVIQSTGFSLSSLGNPHLAKPPVPTSNELTAWRNYTEQFTEQLVANTDYACAGEVDQLGWYQLAVKSGAYGQIASLVYALGPQGVVANGQGEMVIIRHGYREGLSAAELYALVPGAREQLARYARYYDQLGSELPEQGSVRSFHVLARARRAQHPGIAFARAAAIGEIDPLVDEDSRLFVGV